MEFYNLVSEEMFLLTLKNGTTHSELMGENFIGFKFIGENSKYWNTLLKNTYPDGFVLTDKVLSDNNITYSSYDSSKW